MKTKLQVSVRNIVEYVLQSGDLVADQFISRDRLQDGIKAHRKIQKSRPADKYQAEVSVQHIHETDAFILEISGRIDGIFTDQDKITIEEIKTTTADLNLLDPAGNPIHWGQAKLYAFMYAAAHQIAVISVQLTYYQTDTRQVVESKQEFTISELETFYTFLVDHYLAWAKVVSDAIEKRNQSIKILGFPYADYRPGQRQMAVSVYKTIRDNEQLVIQAPTGIGKTIAVIFPAIKAFIEYEQSKVFYLTARTTGKAIAEQTLKQLNAMGLSLKTLTLTAKEKICFLDETTCNGIDCPYAAGYYDRVKTAILELYSHGLFTRELIEAIAEKHTVCPFELSLELSLWADLIICDYNYVFDPQAHLKRLLADEIINRQDVNYTLLIDEAHQLVDRARDMFSAQLNKQTFLELRRMLKKEQPAIYKLLGEVNKWLMAKAKSFEENEPYQVSNGLPEEFLDLLRDFMKATEKYLVRNEKSAYRKALMDIYFEILSFMRISELFDENYLLYYQPDRRDLIVRLFCVHPAKQISAMLAKLKASVFFSATMMPVDYFKHILGISSDGKVLILPSPFPPENLKVLIYPKFSTRLKDREKTKQEIAELIHVMINCHQGNYFVFFPSYQYMQSIYEIFPQESGIETIIQTPAMGEAERVSFLERFSAENTSTLAGFAVMGGIFSEGIDLVGDRLTAAIIIGVGLPSISAEREIIRLFYNTEHKGYEYAYQFPGINRVLQAAGRVIRTETDRGIVCLIDDRFLQAKYKRLYPSAWQIKHILDFQQLENELNLFWGKS